ncbi:MAG: hypothetical protein LH613_14090 [Chamaesiphon sp.]|nr:hypothetical protein [Chamaesiphon sp.]
MKTNSFQSLCRNTSLTLAGALTLAAVSTASQADKAAAVNLKFNNPVEASDFTYTTGALGPGISSRIVRFASVATGIDAKVTATPFTGAAPGGTGTDYTFSGHLPNYSTAAGEPAADLGFKYDIGANRTGKGGLTYQIEFFNTGSNYTTAIAPANFRFLVYDVDGEPAQKEAVRIAKNSGLVSYQLGGNTSSALTFSQNATSYLFSGRGVDQLENDSSGAAIFNFDKVNAVTFQFEADTTTSSGTANRVFSAIDGDLSYLSSFSNGGAASFGAVVAVPEPFTVIGSIIGGTAAFRMRKKLKASTKA